MTPVRDTAAMIAAMAPDLRPGTYVFRTLPEPGASVPDAALAAFREAEGLSLILPDDGKGGLAMRCITLRVHSALDGVGLTAAVAGRLAAAGIACNMVAAFHHDHVFVPADLAGAALAELRALQAGAAAP